MQRISSTIPHKIQPHQKDTLNHKQKLLAKRAAAKVVRRKINESQQLSKSNINNTTQVNQSQLEQQQQQQHPQPQSSKILSPSNQNTHQNNHHQHQQQHQNFQQAHINSQITGNQQQQNNVQLLYQQNHYPKDMLQHSNNHNHNIANNNNNYQQQQHQYQQVTSSLNTNHSTSNTDLPSQYQQQQQYANGNLNINNNNKKGTSYANTHGSLIGTSNSQNNNNNNNSNNTRLTSNIISQNQSQNATGVFSQGQVQSSGSGMSVNKVNVKMQGLHISQQQQQSSTSMKRQDQHYEEEKQVPSLKGPVSSTSQQQRHQQYNQSHSQYNSNKTNYATSNHLEINNNNNNNSNNHHFDQKNIDQQSSSQARHKPTQSYISSVGLSQTNNGRQSNQTLSQQQNDQRGQGDGEKMLNKRHQMRLTSGDSRRGSTAHHNITRSLIEEGSEDFTNIEERLQEDTRISCRNAVASSLNNVSQMIKQVKQQQQQQQNNLRNRRGTVQSNLSGAAARASNQPSKEETFESSSFFDEGVSQKLVLQSQQQQQNYQGNGIVPPHRCNQVEGYNLPTIFNTLMFGIDQSKVSDNIRESFTNLSHNNKQGSGRPSSQYQQKQQNNGNSGNGTTTQYQKKLSNKFAANQASQQQQQYQGNNGTNYKQQNQPQQKSGGGISSLVTKVDKISSPIMVFDQSTVTTSQQKQLNQQQQQQQQLSSRNNVHQTAGHKDAQQQSNRSKQQQQQNKSKSPNQHSNPMGRQSQLKLAAHQNLKIEQHIEALESINTEMLNSQGMDGFQNRLAQNINQNSNQQHQQQLDTDHHNDLHYNDNNQEDDQLLDQQEEEDQDQEIEQQQQNVAANQIEDFQSSELHRNHLIQTLQSLQYIKTLPPVNKNDIKSRTVKLPPFRSSHIKKTIIFDLDETLVHCIDDIENNPCDELINVTFPNGETVQAGINIRPYAIDCLKKANENYQVVVFTASHKAYADVVLDSLDPDRSLIQYRLYREHCIRTEEGIYIKDLRIISNRNLKDVIIVDNAVYSFGYQLDNGIPIIPFYDDKSDEELMHLIFYFNCLAQCGDVREQNRKAFQLKDLQEIDIAEYLQSMMNNKNNQVKNQQNNDDEEEEEEEQ